MSNPQTFFEQIPVETVKKIFQEKVRRTKKEIDSKDVTVPQPAPGTNLPVANNPSRSTDSAHKEGRFMTDESSDDLRYPEWQRPIQAAMLEFDPQQLHIRIATAEAAISTRLAVLSETSDGDAERLAIQDGVRLLRFLKERPLRTA